MEQPKLDLILLRCSQILTWGAGDSAKIRLSRLLSKTMLFEGCRKSFYSGLLLLSVTARRETLLCTITDYEEGKFQFSSATFSGQEDILQVIATINRVSGTRRACYCKNQFKCYWNSSSEQSSDYTDIDTTVSFADGETTKECFYILKDDNVAEFSEFFQLTLSNPTGATLGSIRQTANVEIKDTDSDFTSTLKLC